METEQQLPPSSVLINNQGHKDNELLSSSRMPAPDTKPAAPKLKNEKNRNAGGGGGAKSSHQFRTPQPQQFIQQKKKMWNKRQKCHFQKQQQQQTVISKADLENIQNVKNQMSGVGGAVVAAVISGDIAIVAKNLKPQVYNNKKNGGVSAVHNANGGGGIGGGGALFCPRSKFFLPDKPPRKEAIIPPTKFLLGGNISDPLNLNSLQNEAINSNNNTPVTTPRQSPMTTPPKVEVIIPPNIHDPLHLLDPVDSMEYEKQLTSPMKKKSKSKHRNRKKKPKRRRLESVTSEASSYLTTTAAADESGLSINATMSSEVSDNLADVAMIPVDSSEALGVVGVVDVVDAGETDAASAVVAVTSTDSKDDCNMVVSSTTNITNNCDSSTTIALNNEGGVNRLAAVTSSTAVGGGSLNLSGRRSVDRERIKKDLLLDLSGGESAVGGVGGQRKRKTSESQGNQGKNKFRRLEAMDKIVSPVVPQPGAWKRPPRIVPTGARKSSRNHSTSVSETELLSPIDEAKKIDADSIRPDTPDPSEISMDDVTSETPAIEKQLPTASAVAARPKFRADGVKYQYGNYDRYSGYRRLNEFMDVRLQVFQRHPELFNGKDILDIGCNVGHMTIAVARNLAPKSILGIDIDKNLVSNARRNLSMFVRIPEDEVMKVVEDSVATTAAAQQTPATAKNQRSKNKKFSKKRQHKNRQNQTTMTTTNPLVVEHHQLFPISFPMCFGGIPSSASVTPDCDQPSPLPTSAVSGQKHIKNEFPKNVYFRQTNYVLKDDSLLSNDTQQYDIIMCLSVTKWIHLNFGDNGLKLAFKRMFNQLRPGGKLILEAQNWASYKKKKNLTETIYNNYRSIEFFPNKFHEFLLSNEVGFSHSYTLGVPRHLSKGFCRPIQLYAKGDFTPSHVQWSDTYHPQTPYEAYRGIYATIPRPVYPIWGSSDTPHGNSGSYSCRQTPMYNQPTSQYYNPLETDSYLPSYDTEVLNRHYVFASPLYQTVWSPPANLKNSASHTPAFGSVREAELLEDGTVDGYHRHVYPPSVDETSSPNANGAFNSIREADTDDSNNQTNPHVYANCDSSSSPRVVDSEISDGIEDSSGGANVAATTSNCCDVVSSD